MSWLTDIRKYYLWRALIKRFTVPILVVHMLVRGLSVEQVGIVAAAGYAVSLLFEAPSGAIADTVGHKKTLVIAGILQSISHLFYFGGEFWWFFSAIVIFSFAQTLMTGTADAMFYERIKEDRLTSSHQKFSGRARASGQAFGILSMVVSGFAYAWQWWLPFVMGAVQFLLAAYIISHFQEAKQIVSVKKKEGAWEVARHLVHATKTVWRNRAIFWIVALDIAIIGIFLASIEFQQVLFVDAGLTAALIGLVYACKRVCGMTAALIVHKFSEGNGGRTFMLFASSTLCLSLVIILVAPNVYWLAAAVSMTAASYHSLVVVVNDQINKLTRGGSRATVLSVANMYRGFFSIVLVLVWGWLSVYIPMQQVYGMVGIVGFALLALLTKPLLRNMPKRRVRHA